MSDTPANPAEAPAGPKKKKSGAVKWIVISLVILLLLGGAGGAAAWWFLRAPADEAEGEGEAADAGGEAPHAVATGIVPMEQFLVNLADKEASRFVRVTLRLVVGTEEEAAEVEKNEVTRARLRSAILEVLTQQTSDVLVTPAGKEQLKKVIAEKAGPVLGKVKVHDVLFTDFVVQF